VAAPRAAHRRFDFADIVRAHRARLESTVRLGSLQRRVLSDIEKCRTVALGGHLDQCITCGHEHPSYNSCRNRHCPKCQALAQERWIEAQRARMLDVPHFHVVFTLPAELRPLAAFARRVVFRALFRATHKTLATFARRRLSATVGATLVLHTWTRKLEFHPHIHAIVTGGGLSSDGARWSPSHRAFLFPVKAMSKVFRAKMLAELRRAYRQGRFARFRQLDDPEAFARLTASVAKVDWHLYAKPSFTRGRYVIEYLGRYTHRVGLANSRFVAVNDAAVTFRTKHGDTTTVDPLTLLRRFVQHVLPSGFHKIRHVGLYGSSARRKLARAVLGTPAVRPKRISWRERLRRLIGRDVTRCPLCDALLFARPLTASLPLARAPPLRLLS
jgi:hypothetical protein